MTKIKKKSYFYSQKTGEKWDYKDSTKRYGGDKSIKKKSSEIYKNDYPKETFINPNKNKIWNMPTKNQLDKIPPLYAQDGKGKEAKVYMKLFSPDKTYYITEFDKKTGDMFGYVKVEGGESEWGYTNYNDLKLAYAQSKGMNYLDRDIHFKPTKVREIKAIK